MQPLLIKVNILHESSFSVNRYTYPDKFPSIWQFHDKYELTLIIHGEGTRMAGDHIDHFEEGDLIFVGKKLPHTMEDKRYSCAGKLRSIGTSFLRRFFGRFIF